MLSALCFDEVELVYGGECVTDDPDELRIC
jgi:hypothetical protein